MFALGSDNTRFGQDNFFWKKTVLSSRDVMNLSATLNKASTKSGLFVNFLKVLIEFCKASFLKVNLKMIFDIQGWDI